MRSSLVKGRLLSQASTHLCTSSSLLADLPPSLQALVWWMVKTTAAIFAAWVQHVQRHHQRKHDGVRALFSYAGALKRKAFLAWHEDHQGRAALQQQAQHAFASMADFRLCLAFDAW